MQSLSEDTVKSRPLAARKEREMKISVMQTTSAEIDTNDSQQSATINVIGNISITHDIISTSTLYAGYNECER